LLAGTIILLCQSLYCVVVVVVFGFQISSHLLRLFLSACFMCVLANRPPLRQFLMDGDFFVGAALATTLTKLALRYVAQTPDKRKQNVSF